MRAARRRQRSWEPGTRDTAGPPGPDAGCGNGRRATRRYNGWGGGV